MNIVITGAGGFLGKSLCEFFISEGNTVYNVHRKDFISKNLLYEKLDKCDIIVNLAGENIVQRWNKGNKKKIFESRVSTTEEIVNYLNKNKRNVHFINASAIGLYDSIHKHGEESIYYSNNFLFEVVKSWEEAANKLDKEKNTLTILRIGLVLGNRGGAYRKYYDLVKSYLGAIIGSGFQSLSFIHIEDFCRAIKFILQNELKGTFNLTTPKATTNKVFIKTLAKNLKRPVFFRVPVFFVRLILGNAHILFTEGQNVISKRLLDYGFRFKYTNIESSIDALIKSYPE